MEIDFSLLDSLLRIPSVSSDTAAVNTVTQLLASYLSERGLYCRLETREGRHVLYAATEETRTPDYLLNAHLDVVPAEENQFVPRREGTRLYARGASDCKGSAVTIASVLLESKGKASVGAVFTADEEIGGFTTAHMVTQGYGARKMVLIVDASAYEIAYGQKGTATFCLRANGKGGHSSEPWALQNPIDRLLDGYQRIREEWRKLHSEDAACASAASSPDRWFDTMAATVVRAGTVGNQVPDTAEMLINCRYTQEGGAQKICEQFKKWSGLDVSCPGDCPPVICDREHPELLRLHALMKTRWNDRDIPLTRLNGATDARHFKALGVPIALINPLGGNIHCSDEWVELPSLTEYAQLLCEFVSPASK